MRLHSKAQRRGNDLGLKQSDLRFMAERAAPFTHPVGNLRYHEYWFTVIRGEIWAMGLIGENCDYARVTFEDALDCTYCDGTMRTVMVDDDDKSEEILACPRMHDRQLGLCDQR